MAKGSKKNQEKAAAQAKKRARVEKRNAPAPKPKPSARAKAASSSPKSSPKAQQQQANQERRASNNRPAAKNKVQARLGDEQYKNVSQAGLQDATKQGSYSANEVISEFRNREKGVSVDEGDNSVLARFQKAQAGGATFNKKAQDYLSKYGMDFSKKAEDSGSDDAVKVVTPTVKTPTVVGDVDKSININTGNTSGTGTGNSFDRVFGNNENVIGDNNEISGNVNQGNQDFSTNISGGSNQEGAQRFLDDKIGQSQSFDRTFGNNENTVGDNNKIFGNLNQGNQDFSVNIGGGTGNKSDGGMSNLQYGAASKALMENQYQRNKQTFSAMGNAAGYANAAGEITGSNERINKLDAATDQNIDYYRKASDRATMGVYGDIWNMKAPSWKSPGELDKIETTYDKDDDE